MTPREEILSRFEIREAGTADLPQVAQIEQDLFPSDRLSLRQMRYHLRNERAVFLACVDGERVAGYVLAFQRKNATGRVYSLAVAKDFQGKGIGQQLMRRALETLKERGDRNAVLEVRKADEPTRALYRRIGFRDVRELPAYYEDGADGIKMSIELESL